MYMYICIYIYVYMYTRKYICTYMHIPITPTKKGRRIGESGSGRGLTGTHLNSLGLTWSPLDSLVLT